MESPVLGKVYTWLGELNCFFLTGFVGVECSSLKNPMERRV